MATIQNEILMTMETTVDATCTKELVPGDIVARSRSRQMPNTDIPAGTVGRILRRSDNNYLYIHFIGVSRKVDQYFYADHELRVANAEEVLAWLLYVMKS